MSRFPGLLACVAFASVLTSCATTPDQQYVREESPIVIRRNEPALVHIRALSGNGRNEVGIRCSARNWQALLRQEKAPAIRLVCSNKKSTKISQVSADEHQLWPLESFHYLFSISGEYRANATVELKFPGNLSETEQVVIVVLKTPSDTGL